MKGVQGEKGWLVNWSEWMRKGIGRLQGLSRVRAALVWGIVMLLTVVGAGGVRGQAVKGQIVSVGIGGGPGVGGMYRAGSWVPVQVHLENRSPGPFEGRLAVEQLDLDGDKVLSVGPDFVLQPGVEGRTLWTYYWPRPDDLDLQGVKSVAVMDKNGQAVAKVSVPDNGMGYGIGTRDERTSRSMRFVVVLGKSWAGWNRFVDLWGGTEAIRGTLVTSAQALPDDVKGFDGVDVVVWEADAVKVSDIPPEFQLKAMLEWVKGGGHLIVSVGNQGQEFVKAGKELADAMPMTITGTREVSVADLGGFARWGALLGNLSGKPVDKPLVQAVGDLRPGARMVIAGVAGQPATEKFVDHPVAVTGLCGRGAITLVTFDVTNPEIEGRFFEEKAGGDRAWIQFWTAAAGWQLQGVYYPDAEYRVKKDTIEVETSPDEMRIGQTIPVDVDVKDVTAVRILVAILFLAIYWLVAGPLGHLALRFYKVVHWSWWIFGGTVLAGTAVAGVVVLVLHVTTYDVRHRTFVLGTVGSDEVTVDGFYGVYAPLSGEVELKLPETGSAGINYLTPMCIPTNEDVKPYADPQSYQILWAGTKHEDSATHEVKYSFPVSPVFRSTLKKMQGRWTGAIPGISGKAEYAADPEHVLKGTLTNNTGYDLEGADVIVYFPELGGVAQHWGRSYLYKVGSDEKWKKGDVLDLEKALVLDRLQVGLPRNGMAAPGVVEDLLQVIGWQHSERTGYHIQNGHRVTDSRVLESLSNRQQWPDDLLYVMLDARAPDDLLNGDRRDPVRGEARLTDCTKALHAAGALVVARAGGDRRDVKSPIPMSVNGRQVEGKGQVLFAFALPVTGVAPTSMLVPTTGAAPPLNAPIPVRGNRGNTGEGPNINLLPERDK